MTLREALGSRARRPAPRARGLALGVLACLGTFGCSSPPSYVVSWTLFANDADASAALELDSVRQCSEVGVAKVRVTAESAGVIVSEAEYPCFPGSAIEGPTLEPGTYSLTIEGLRRTGGPWDFDPELTTEDLRIAYAEAELTVVEGQDPPSLEFMLRAPPQCDDGIDNDGDGRVDVSDPACLLDATNPELADSGVSLIQASVNFLSEEPNTIIRPSNLFIDAFRVEVDGQTLTTVPSSALDESRAPFRLPLLSADLLPGSYSVSLTALDGDVAVTEPVVAALDLAVPEEQTGFLVETFTFADTSFLEPIDKPFGFSQELLLSASTDQVEVTSSCEMLGFGTLIDSLRVRVTDLAAGQFLDAATVGLRLGNSQQDPVEVTEEPDSWIRILDCPTAGVFSDNLPWGLYELELEGQVAGQPCFSTAQPQLLSPQFLGTNVQPIELERVYGDDDLVPFVCRECNEDSDCKSSTRECVDNLCVDIEFGDQG